MKNRFREFIQAFFFRLSPFLIVAALECLLIIFGVGQSYRLFREKSQNDILAMNKSYHGRFYSIEKYEQPNYLTPVFSREKPANTRRLFFVCDQTLFNLFEHAESQPLLRDFRDKNGVNYEIVQISVPLTNSFFVMQVLKHLQNQDSDGIVVMTGGNEFYGLPRHSSWLKDINNYYGLKCYTSAKSLRIMQVLEQFVFIEKPGPEQFPPESIDRWVVPFYSEEYVMVKSYFQRNLKTMAPKKDIPVFLIIPPINDRAEPFRSFFEDEELRDDDIIKECRQLMKTADEFTLNNWLRNLESWESESAVLHYCRAMIYEKNGKMKNAADSYEKAREMDGFRVLPQSGLNEDIKNACLLWGYHCVNVDSVFRRQTMGSGEKLFKSRLNMNRTGLNIFRETLKESLIDFFSK